MEKAIKTYLEENGHYCWRTKFREIENYIPISEYRSAVLIHHKKQRIKVDNNPYADRNTIIDLDSNPSHKSFIKIPQNLFSVIQKNGNGKTTGINSVELRKGVESALQDTLKNTFKTSKFEVAKQVIIQKPEIIEKELKQEINKIIVRIKRANNANSF